MNDSIVHDVIIIGGGPGGYTAALYCARASLKVLVLEKLAPGGQMCLTDRIDNYPGFEDGIDGFSLGEKMRLNAERFGAKTLFDEVLELDLSGKIKKVKTSNNVFSAKAIIIASGAEPRELGLENEKELVGKGISYCATCDGMFFKGKTVAIVGGGNTAAADAALLSRICKKVYIIHRRDTLRADKIYHIKLQETENIEFLWNSTVTKLIENGKLSALTVKNVITNEEKNIDTDGIFISIGRKPTSAFLEKHLLLDSDGYIVADETTRTNIPGVFAVGDVRTKSVRQIVTACADGAVACHFVEEYLDSQDFETAN